MTSKVTSVDRTAGIEDLGRVSDAGRQRPDPEVPERARRRTFTAKYKLEILASYEAAADGEKGALFAGKACTPATSTTGGGPVTPARWPG